MFWAWFCGIVAAIVLLFALFVTVWGRILREMHVSVSFPGLPSEFDGYRIALISDLHDRRFGKENRSLVKAVLAAAPDIVVTAGDMHEGPHSPEPVYALYAGLSEKVPVYYTEGNHDLRNGRRRPVSPEEYAEHLRSLTDAGAIILNDTVVPLERNGQIVLLYGQSWGSSVQGKTPSFDSAYPSVLVCHDPLQFDRIETLPDLMLSGHVHGGLLRLPFIGPVFAPGNGALIRKRFARRFFFPKYSRGLYRKGGHTLAVTQGLGFAILPIRFIRPEIMVLTLKSDKKMNNS